jgi:hypothetical protein
MDCVRPSALGTDAMVGTHRPVAPWLSRGANSGDPGGQTASSTQRPTVRVVACGSVLVQGRSASRCLTARWIRTGLRTRNTRNAGAIRRGCLLPATPPRSAVPDNVWSQNGSKGKRPYPIQGRCGRRPSRRLGSRFVPAKGPTDRAGAVRRLGTEPRGRAVAGASAAATRAVPARPGKNRCG